jgi:hypothetical protein
MLADSSLHIHSLRHCREAFFSFREMPLLRRAGVEIQIQCVAQDTFFTAMTS